MQIVIDLDETLYEILTNSNKFPTIQTANRVCDAVEHGTPLPKGHDRLVEAHAVVKALFDHKTIDDVPTIIEADKTESGET